MKTIRIVTSLIALSLICGLAMQGAPATGHAASVKQPAQASFSNIVNNSIENQLKLPSFGFEYPFPGFETNTNPEPFIQSISAGPKLLDSGTKWYIMGRSYSSRMQLSPSPYVVFVNGWLNCCASSMTDLKSQLINQMYAEPRNVPYSNFNDGGSSHGTSTDEDFLRYGADFINNQLDRNRPLILIGHSFGGDSVLKLLPRINRRIQFVAVIDPVRTGGFRAPLKLLTVPSSVDYFYNRWQENLPFPNDFNVNGSIPCNAKKCDQDSQNIDRNWDYSPKSRPCTDLERVSFQCPDSGRVSLRVNHQGLPTDGFIQKDIGDKIQKLLSAPTSVPNRYEAGILHPNGKAYLFAGGRYYRFDFQLDWFDFVGRVGIDGWKGLPANVGAAVRHPNGKAYFFTGDKYYRFDFRSDQVDKVGTIGVEGWKGLPANIGAAILHPNGKAHFFAGDKYYRFDFQSDQVDKVGTIGVDGWRGVPPNIEAATAHPNGKAYFFVGSRYYRFDFQSDQVDKVGTTGVDGWRVR